MTGYAAILLAGGAARRMGGVDKPARAVGGRSMLHRVLAAVADADQRIVVGPSGPVPEGVRTTREEPPGGGPVAATAAGLALLDPGTTTVAVLAADLPLLTTAAVAGLRRALADPTAGPDDGSKNASAAGPDDGSKNASAAGPDDASAAGPDEPATAGPEDAPAAARREALKGRTAALACYVDGDGRRQHLCAIWRFADLRAALDRLAATRDGSLDGAPVRGLLADLVVREVSWSGSGPPPWFDCDTDEDVRRAEEWTR
ncbi:MULTISPECIES: NTP transferase domain-containing protein [unclassified Micromonospora]|uniref:molybdenum cofactor guanylyltransferase n=1 Tax=unclassified Micromonospora TaxID=2617518 RepID=UPI001C2154A0|nr:MULTISPECIES: NTP transferase domain-containing protein [unclassified Micromonospora]MBU8857902.1 NTP transferase domain-containing protein [Micromonospora sp. WMMB482]MDM4783533.1 NTP transferase domain-containing protein [Micromonospora sp. b486]